MATHFLATMVDERRGLLALVQQHHVQQASESYLGFRLSTCSSSPSCPLRPLLTSQLSPGRHLVGAKSPPACGPWWRLSASQCRLGRLFLEASISLCHSPDHSHMLHSFAHVDERSPFGIKLHGSERSPFGIKLHGAAADVTHQRRRLTLDLGRGNHWRAYAFSC